MKKNLLRTLYLEKRLALTPTEYLDLSRQIYLQTASFSWSLFKTIHLFLPISKFKEVDTFQIIRFFKSNYPLLRIVVPRSHFEKMEMESIVFDMEQIKNNKYGIPEPVNGITVPTNEIDAVLVPLLAFDQTGKRVGYGKGFYDRFLAQCRPETRKIGLSFFDPIDAIEDANQWDITLDACICPNKIWEFNAEL